MGQFYFSLGCFLMLRVLALCLLVTLSFAQFRDVDSVDAFETVTPDIIITLPQNPSFPISLFRNTNGNDVIGGQRNILLTANSGVANLVLASGISNEEFFASTPNGASGSVLVQYDGDDGSISLSPNGLGGADLTAEGAFAFHLVMETDIPTTCTLRVYSGTDNNYCSALFVLPGDDMLHDYYLSYLAFDTVGNGCDFANVGAIELFINMFENVDVLLVQFTTWGPVPLSPTPTRTRTPSPSGISITPTNSPTPSVTPTASPIICKCHCPTFRCALFLDDDDDNFAVDVENSIVAPVVEWLLPIFVQ